MSKLKCFTIFLLIFAFSSPVIMIGQNPKTGLKLLEKKKFGEAFPIFKEAIKTPKNKVVAQFGLASVYGEDEFSGYNIDSAWHYLSEAKEGYRKIKSSQKRKLTKMGAGTSAMSKLGRSIMKSAVAEAEKENTIEGYDKFLESYKKPRASIKREITKQRDELAAAAAVNAVRLEDCDVIFEKYGPSMRSSKPPSLSDAQKNLFDLFVKKKGWDALGEFDQKYPQNPFVTDPARDQFLKIRKTGQIELFDEFRSRYPESAYASMAVDSTNAATLKNLKGVKKAEAYLAFIRTNPQSEEIKEIDEELSLAFGAYPDISKYLPTLKNTKVEYLPKTMEAMYELFLKSGDPRGLDQFGSAFPNTHLQDRIKTDRELAKTFQAEILKKYAPEKKKFFEEFIREAAPRYMAFVALQEMIKSDVEEKNWEEALKVAESFRQDFQSDSTYLADLIGLLKAGGEGILAKALNTSVNTKNPEHSPVISADNQYLYFCRIQGNAREDIYVSKMGADGWEEAQSIVPLNENGSNEAPNSISSDGSQLYIFKNGKINVSNRTLRGWRNAGPVGETINTVRWQGGNTVSSDGKALFFAAKREDAVGPNGLGLNIDIYVSTKQPDGEWGPAINIGPVVNTPLVDRSPFLHPDQKTLYFSSGGHGGLGQIDVFKVTRLDDTWTNWSKPVNLGKEINTVDNDWGYNISTDGSTAYFSAGSGWGGSDIFQVTLPQSLRPEEVSTVSGVILDTDGNPMEADIIIEDLDTQEPISLIKSDPQTGVFFIVLPGDKLYSFTVKKDGFVERSDNVDLRGDKEEVQIENYRIELLPLGDAIASGEAFTLKNIFFDFDKSILKRESQPQLNRLAKYIMDKNLRIEVSGHTDDKGTDEYNRSLSDNRAQAVRTYLLSKGVSSERVAAKGFGETKPVDTNETDAGRANNRRVEIRFLK